MKRIFFNVIVLGIVALGATYASANTFYMHCVSASSGVGGPLVRALNQSLEGPTLEVVVSSTERRTITIKSVSAPMIYQDTSMNAAFHACVMVEAD